MTIPLNKRKSEPDICALFDQHASQIKTSMNCISIGTIQSFDSTDQTATILLNYKSKDLYTGNETDYQPLVKCPVFILNGGGAYITFPITKGDQCLVLFCDREIDTWFTKGGTNAPQSARVHDLNDGIALIGIRGGGNFISNYHRDGVRVQTPYFKAEGILEMHDGIDTVFTTGDGKIATVCRGLIVSIT